jgi:hypothetical protein
MHKLTVDMTKPWASAASVTVDGKKISHAIYASEIDGYVVVRKIITSHKLETHSTETLSDGQPLRFYPVSVDFEILKGEVQISLPETATTYFLYAKEREGGTGITQSRSKFA